MKKISKGKEPAEWTAYRKTPNTEFKAIPELKEALLKEQGYICAYCMRRIPTKDGNSNEDARIEHIHCQKRYKTKNLDYNNLVICCPGAITSDFHCDKRKADKDLSFSLFDSKLEETISYSTKDGTIKSSNKDYQYDIDQVLNLNNQLLKSNRLYTLNGVIVQLNKYGPWKINKLKRVLTQWQSKDNEGKYMPYCGIVTWFLKKRIEKAL